MLTKLEVHDIVQETGIKIIPKKKKCKKAKWLSEEAFQIYVETRKAKMLERVWRKGNPLTLLVGMQTSTATMENSVEIP